jgi:hypothetical protein
LEQHGLEVFFVNLATLHADLDEELDRTAYLRLLNDVAITLASDLLD